MDIAALVAWIVTALGGFFLLVRWISGGGLRRQQTGTTSFPAPVVFGHFLLAAAGLLVWIVYLAADKTALAWTSFGVLVAVALLGFTMLARWIPVYRAAPATTEAMTPAERQLPVPVVGAHGLLAATTLVLVLLAAIGVGS
ncbi:MAG: hypothetical protein HOY76_20270 [Streptomyces sp.]|nr:hypothetical protein [Streptomyces sp.]